jgi:hypothetical protein
MLHPIKPVTCLVEMNNLVQFQRGVLELCVHLSQGNAYAEGTFQKILGSVAGSWFWKVCEGNQEWRSDVEKLKNVCSKYPVESLQILPAFDNDIGFQDHLSDSSYTFQYPLLPKELKEAIQPLCEYFYTYLGKTGYGQEVHERPNFRLNRTEFLRAYEETGANGTLYVCPICDKEISDGDVDENIAVCDLDHFFPKSVYPFLSVHPYNLIPACKECNSKFKGILDPLSDAVYIAGSAGAFLDLYHPHKNRAIRSLGRVVLSRDPQHENMRQVHIEDSYNPPHQRVKTAERVYKLTSRWRRRLEKSPGIVNRIVERLCHQARIRQQKTGQGVTMAIMLDEILAEHQLCKILREGNHVLRDAYISFALLDLDEQYFLFEEYSRI